MLIDAEAYQANAYLMPQLDQLSPSVRRNMTEAAAVTDDQVTAANRTRQAVREWFSRMLARHPFLALPTLVGAPPLIGERGMPLTVLTMPANLAGLPALSLPVPGGPAGLPASLQLIGPPGGEEQLIALGRIIEAAIAASPDLDRGPACPASRNPLPPRSPFLRVRPCPPEPFLPGIACGRDHA